MVVVAGEGALLALIPPLELYCDDGWNDTSPVGRSGLVGLGWGLQVLAGAWGQRFCGLEGSACAVASEDKESFTAWGSGLWGWLLPRLRASMPVFPRLWKLYY